MNDGPVLNLTNEPLRTIFGYENAPYYQDPPNSTLPQRIFRDP
jgi:hypothetical protein